MRDRKELTSSLQSRLPITFTTKIMSIINTTIKVTLLLLKARHSAGFTACTNFDLSKNSDRLFPTDAIAKNF
ncbi:MAG: hypothetical protein IM533_18340 [Pseudanabaena sp. M007S1SP1A06QC]|jgi:hypothetical protein|nr:hypothetical protein [Pseudanabaena sp. M007S1SP1A06QC]